MRRSVVWPFRIGVVLLSAIAGFGCTHTPTTASSLIGPLPALEPGQELQLTYGSLVDSSQRWTPDGSGIIYTYFDQMVTGGVHCFGIIPREGGTRSWSYCDTRGSQADSISRLSQPALNARGDLFFLQSVYVRPTARIPWGPPKATALWITDTASPAAHRRKLVEFPVNVGGVAISWIDQPEWIDDSRIVMLGQRAASGGNGTVFPEAVLMIVGTITPAGMTLEAIPGTNDAVHWTRHPSGDLLYLRGERWSYGLEGITTAFRWVVKDSVIYRVPLTGGARTIFARTPRRLGSIDCKQNICIASDEDNECDITCRVIADHSMYCAGPADCVLRANNFYDINPANGAFQIISKGTGAFPTPLRPVLSPTRSEILYLRDISLYHAPLLRP